MKVVEIEVCREAEGQLQQGKLVREGEKHPLRPRHTRRSNTFRLKQRALAKPELLEPVAIDDEEEDKLPLTNLLGVIRKKRSMHGRGNKVTRPIFKEEGKREDILLATKKPKTLSLPLWLNLLCRKMMEMKL